MTSGNPAVQACCYTRFLFVYRTSVRKADASWEVSRIRVAPEPRGAGVGKMACPFVVDEEEI
jgi:hypothetical protein